MAQHSTKVWESWRQVKLAKQGLLSLCKAGMASKLMGSCPIVRTSPGLGLLCCNSLAPPYAAPSSQCRAGVPSEARLLLAVHEGQCAPGGLQQSPCLPPLFFVCLLLLLLRIAAIRRCG